VYNIQNLPDAIELLTQATLRDLIASMNLDDTFSSREEINDKLLSKVGGRALLPPSLSPCVVVVFFETRPGGVVQHMQIQLDCERWGVIITRIEIFNIMPPTDIQNAMENQIKSERTRRSTVLEVSCCRRRTVQAAF
jgi:regulator of protease activity HflC (stomatin/prohibitin superfamily)